MGAELGLLTSMNGGGGVCQWLFLFISHNTFTPDLIARKYLEHLNSLKFHMHVFCLWLCMHEPSSPANAIVRSYWLFVHFNPGTKWSVLVLCWFSNHYFMMWLLYCSNITCQQSTAAARSLQTAVNILLCHAVHSVLSLLMWLRFHITTCIQHM